MHQVRHLIRATRFGPVAVVWLAPPEEPKIIRVILSRHGSPAARMVEALFPDSRPGASSAASDVACRIKAFLSGCDARFGLEEIRLDLCSPFQASVLRAEYGIPRGRVSTYNLIARHLGKPSAARAVGRGLATNPFPIIIPCHRAVRCDGAIGGYQGGPAMKRALLEMEGIKFDASGKVAPPTFHYAFSGSTKKQSSPARSTVRKHGARP
jgi:methylated-DNA-[protein]-cysteine S-methyltransferase